jgi:hypothetical protein
VGIHVARKIYVGASHVQKAVRISRGELHRFVTAHHVVRDRGHAGGQPGYRTKRVERMKAHLSATDPA